MKSILAASFFVVALGPARPSGAEDKLFLYSAAFDKAYELTVSKEALAKSKWSDDAENPPISAKKAISLADTQRSLIVKDHDPFKWRLKDLTLSPIDGRWYWTVNYHAMPEVDGAGFTELHSIMIVVLMDGTVIAPKDVTAVEAPKNSK